MKRAAILVALMTLSSVVAAGPREDSFSDPEKSFQAAFEMLQKQYVDSVTPEQLYQGAVEGMLAHAGGREWDKLLSPADMAEMKSSLSGEIVGIGVEIKFDPDSGLIGVKRLIPGGAAEKAGLAAGDQILKIDGRSYKGKAMREVVDAIRGREGDSVSLTVLRDDKVFTRTIARSKVVVATVTDTMLPGGAGLIAISSFNEKTPELVKASLAKLAKAGARGLVIDLRGCPGGLLDAFTSVADLLIPSGKTVVVEIGRDGATETISSKGTPVLQVPTSVLINGETASSAELLAGALQQSAGARLVGKKTVGKWNVQRLDELPNGWAVKYTIGTFRTPNGEALDGVGLLPDLEVEMDPASIEAARRQDGAARLAADAQLRVAVNALRL